MIEEENKIPELKGIRLMLKWDKLQSVNKLYVRTRSGMTMSPEARKFKLEVTKQVRKQLPDDLPFGPNDVFKVSLHFLIKERFFVRDTSNFIKLVEDTLFDELGINDARNLVLDCRKSHLKGSENEYIKVTIEKSDFNYNFFNESPLEESLEDKMKHENLEDKMYSKDEMEQYYAKGLLDCMKWELYKDLEMSKTKIKLTK